VINEEYRLSVQRKHVLRRFEKSKVLVWRVYFSGELRKLLSVPEERRTDLGPSRGQGQDKNPGERPWFLKDRGRDGVVDI